MAAAESYRRRTDDTSDDALRELIRDAVREAMPPHQCLSDDELSAVRLLVVRESQRAKFRTAVIEKSLLGLVWAAVGAAIIILREYAIAHGMWRP